ncbi:MAG: HEAT repeat domain-containing protein [Gemmatimonadota bacterium]|nr:HEAT repeat domain-containing protein [Gemmatimonadota bacterium]MDH5758321.1 HEAT repeat domain-containing protein [Gemmatimonadota bacterium]
MSAARVLRLAGWLAMAAGVAPAIPALPGTSGAGAQTLERQMEEVGTGSVRFAFATREGVEICAEGIRRVHTRVRWNGTGSDGDGCDCAPGPLEVEVGVREGRPVRVEVVQRDSPRGGGAVELGEVDPRAAVDFLLGLARGDGGSISGDLVMPAALADVPDVWQDLIGIAGDRQVHERTRKNALFWVGQEAADAATAGLADIAFAEDEDQGVRDAAVFALSQQSEDRGVPALMTLAREADEAKTRRTAMFWLAQSRDPRVLEFFREVLLARR